MLEQTDPVSNVILNDLVQKLINNDMFMNKVIETLVPKVEEHTTKLSEHTTAIADKLGKDDGAAYTWVMRGSDTRNANDPPSKYLGYELKTGFKAEFKSTTSINLPAVTGVIYVMCLTFVPWSDKSGGYPVQIAICDHYISARSASSETTWGSWKTIITF